MPEAHRKNDPNNGGGRITTIPQGSVFANNLLISVNGSIGTGHGNSPHNSGGWKTSNGSPDVFAENISINRKGDSDTCGHSRATGSPNVFINS